MVEFPREVRDISVLMGNATTRYIGNVHVIPVVEDKPLDLSTVPATYRRDLREGVSHRGGMAKVGKRGTATPVPRKGDHAFVLMGVGKAADVSYAAHDSHVRREAYRNAVGAAVTAGLELRNGSRMTIAPLPEGIASREWDTELFMSAAEAAVLASYAGARRFNSDATKDPVVTDIALLHRTETRALSGDFKRRVAVAQSENLARYLTGAPSLVVTPQRLVDAASQVHECEIDIIDKVELSAHPQGHPYAALAAVARASDEAFLVRLDYRGNPRSKHRTVLIGKGITFDTGGTNLKPTDGIGDMYGDKGGAATVIGVMKAAAETGFRGNLTAYIATTENNLGPRAYKPGEMIWLGTDASGKPFPAIRVLNTDAEGRMVMATAAALVGSDPLSKRYVDRVVSVSTLTGAMCIALGGYFSGGHIADETDLRVAPFVKALHGAGQDAYELFVHFPVPNGIEGRVDNKEYGAVGNIGAPPRLGSAQDGATFVRRFLSGLPYNHLDIAPILQNPPDTRTYVKGEFSLPPVRAVLGALERMVDKR